MVVLLRESGCVFEMQSGSKEGNCQNIPPLGGPWRGEEEPEKEPRGKSWRG